MPLTATLQIIADDAHASPEGRAVRRAVTSESTLRLAPGIAHDVIVEDLSVTGCLLQSTVPMTPGTRFRLGLRGGGSVEGEVVRYAPGGYGCTFPTPIPPMTFAASFGANDVVRPLFPDHAGRFAGMEPEIARWPRPVRAAVIVGCAVAAWSLVGAATLWL